MANRIKGITVEIGGDTTGLDKALKSVNSTIRTTQSSLRDVNRLLKLDPSNTTLLTQKQKFLKDSISATKEKLDGLKDAQTQAKKQLEEGTLGKDKYDALEREIIDTENALKKLEKESATCNTALAKISDVGSKMEKVGDSVTTAGKKMMPLSAGITAMGAAAVKITADFDTSMSKVSAISGATGDEFDKLREKAREMGAKTKFSAADAADAMVYMAMAGWKTEDMLSGIAGIMDLAAASGEELATTSDIVTDALTAFGLSAKDSAHFSDILAAASSNSNTNVSMMGETFKYAASIAGSLGYSAEDTAQAIGLMANAGIKSSQAGTSLRTIMTSLSKDFSISGKNIGKVTVATTNADGSMRSLNDILADTRTAFSGLTEAEKTTVAKTLVGKNAMSGFLSLMNASPKDVEKLQSAIENCNGATDSMARTMQDNLEGQLENLSSAVEELAISFGDAMMPVIRSVVDSLQSFIDGLNKMSEGTRNVILRIGLFVAALGPFLVIVGTMISKAGIALQAFSSLAGGLSMLSLKVGGISGPFAKVSTAIAGISLPVLAVVAVITVLVAAFVHLWKTNDTFRKNITSSWNKIASAITTFIDQIRERLAPFQAEFSMVAKAIYTIWDGLCQLLAPIFESAFSVIAVLLKTTLDAIVGLLDIFIGLFTGDWRKFFIGIQTVTLAVMSGIQNTMTTILYAIKGISDVVLSWFSTSWSEIWSGLQTYTLAIWKSIRNAASTTWGNMKKDALTKCRSIKASVVSNWNGIKSSTSSIFSGVKDEMTSKLESAKDKIKGIIDKIKGLFHFSVSTPNIPLPHFSISPSGWKVGDLLKGKIPQLSVKWYAAAMKDGMILNRPTIFGMSGSSLLAGGEAGSETVVGTQSLMQMIETAMSGVGNDIANAVITANKLQASGSMGGDIHLDVYLFKNGPKMGEEIVHAYDTYKRRLG